MPVRAVDHRPRLSKRKKLAFSVALLVIVLAVVEVGSRVAIAFAPGWLGMPVLRRAEVYELHRQAMRHMIADRPEAFAEIDPHLGWRPKPEVVTPLDRISSQGLRAEREYSRQPGPGVLRVVAIGDSFVYGSEVPGGESWARVIEKRSPQTEVLNLGVPGYGPGQAVLRLEAEGLDYEPHVVLLGFSPDSLARAVNVFFGFREPRPTTSFKPRFELDDAGGLRLVEAPIRSADTVRSYIEDPDRLVELGEHDFWYEPAVYESFLYEHCATARLLFAAWSKLRRRYLDPDRPLAGGADLGVYNEASEGFEIICRLAERFVKDCREANARPIIVLFPDRYSVARARSGVDDMFAPFERELRARDIAVWNLSEAFVAQPAGADIDNWFMPGGHYSPEGNRIVAEWLLSRLGARDPRK